MDLVVRGRVVTPRGTLDRGWVAVEGARIAAVGEGRAPAAARTEDRGGAWILPGVVDGQTHATSAGGLPGIAAHTRSALAGGVTTLVDMPFDNPLPLDRPERFAAKADAVAEHAHADMALYATVTRETGTDHVAALAALGAVAFKVSAFESSPTRFPRIPADLLLDLLEALAPTDLPLGLHNEDQEIVLARMARARAAGADGIEAHSAARPVAAELASTAHLLALGEATGAHVHPVHLSTAEGVALVARFAAAGARATAETCVHYLWFDAARDGARLGARMKVNPPIRPGAVEGLWAAVARGDVALVSSDHSSWPLDGKLTPSIFDAGAGVPGLETLLPAFVTGAATRGLDAPGLAAEMLARRPARLFGLDAKGAIEPGRDADLVALEPGPHVWDEAAAQDGLRWSPYHGETFTVRVAATWLRGAPAFDGRAVLARPGDGRLVRRGATRWSDPGRPL